MYVIVVINAVLTDVNVCLCFMLTAYAFAELIDNALAATVDNVGPRKIELRLVGFPIFVTAYCYIPSPSITSVC